jgi:tRNA threonylcarbamoyladenosine biosynthesis protein TsaE
VVEEIFVSNSPEETIQKGRELGAGLSPHRLILLSGELGSGKTTLAKGIIAGLGAAKEEEVASPTYTLVHLFVGRFKVYHIDLYRVASSEELGSLGIEDLFDEDAVILVEWPDRLRVKSNWPSTQIHLGHLENGKREIRIARDSKVERKNKERS